MNSICPLFRGSILAILLHISMNPALPAQTGQITGTVYDELTSTPAGALTVQLEGPDGEVLDSVATDTGTGIYAFTGLADGFYRVRVVSDPASDLVGEYYRDVNEFDGDLAARLEISGANSLVADFYLARGGSISGSLFGLAVGEDVSLQLYDAWSGRYRGGAGSSAGAFTVGSLPQSTYKLFVDPFGTDRAVQWYDGRRWLNEADPIAVGNDEDVSGKDLTLTAGTSISGTVALSPDPGDGGATLEQIRIEAFDATTYEYVGSRNVSASGAYDVTNLPPGSYRLQAQTYGTPYVYEVWVPGAGDPFQDPVFDMNEAAPVAVDVGSPATGIDFLLEEGRSISGHVSLDGASDVVGATVQADKADGGGFGNWASTDAFGNYTVSGLTPGQYHVRVESRSVDEPFVAELWQDKALDEPADDVDATLADATGIDFEVGQARVISGKIFLDANDDQVQQADEPGFLNATVRVYDFATGHWLGHAAIAPDGRWAIGVLPGVYQVEASPHQPNLFWEYWQNVYFSEDAQPVDVRTADAEGVDFGLVDATTVGTLRGRVVDTTAAGISGVDVQVWRFETGNQVASGTTDATGAFTLTNVPPGSYRVFFETRGRNAAGGTDYVASFWSSGGGERIDFPAVAGDGTDLGTFGLATGGSISGTVVPPAGDSLPLPFEVQAEYVAGSGPPLPGATIESDGSYHLRGLPAGLFRVLASTYGTGFVPVYYWTAAESTFDLQRATPVEVEQDLETAGIDLHLVRAFRASGRVTEADGVTPIPDLRLSASGLDVSYWGQDRTDANGEYEIRNLPAGRYEIAAEPDGADFVRQRLEVDLTSGDVTGVDFALAAGAVMSGRVYEDLNGNGTYDAGEERADVDVQADAFDDGQYAASGTSGADGHYEIRGLGAGRYRVYVQSGEHNFVRMYYPDIFANWNAGPVEVTEIGGVPQDLAGIDFRVLRGHEIHGSVFYDANGDGVRQLPGEIGLANVSVNAELQGESGIDHVWAGTDADGNYVLHGVYPGRHLVSAHAGGTPYASELYKSVGGTPVGTYRRSEADQVDVTSGDATGIDFSLGLGGGITGTVRDAATAEGLGAIELWVDTFDGDGLWWNGRTDPQGRYLVTGLSPGSFRIQAWDPRGVHLGEYHLDAYFYDDAAPVSVALRSSPTDPLATVIDFDLDSAASIGTLRGQVTSSGGIPGVDVQIWRFADDSYVANVFTDAGGNFVFTELPPGSYKIYFETSETNAEHDTNYLPTFWSSTGVPGVIDPNLLRVDFPETPGDGTDLGTFELEAGGAISGTVFPPDGETLPAGLTVSAQSFESGGRHLPAAAVDAAGKYRIRGVPAPATYRVQADAWGTGLVSVYYLTAAESTFDHGTAAAVQVDAGAETADVDLHLFRGGSISGRVTRASDGTAVTDFPISVHMVDDPLGRDYWDGTQTGPDGTYTVSGLPGGDYEVRTDAREGDLANQTYPGFVSVTEPDDTPGIDFDLGPAGRVLGRVTQVVGGVTVPLVNVRVQADDFATGNFVSDAHTDANGEYRLEALPQGRDYRIQVRPWDHPDPQFFNFIGEYWNDRLTWDEADPVTVAEDPGRVVEVAGIDFELALGGAISGIVHAGGQPLQNVWVWAEDFFGFAVGNGDHTDHNGLYVIRGLPPGSYRVQANPWPQDYVPEYFDDTSDWNLATPVSVSAVPDGGPIPITDHVDFDLAPAFRVSGRVTESDGTTPIADLRVSVWNDRFYDDALTRADGAWEIRGVPAGLYTVATATEGTDWIRQEQQIEVVDADVGGVDFVLQLGAAIRGRVFEDDGDGVYQPGEGRPGVWISASAWDSGQWMSWGESGADGVYEIRGMAPGSYRVYVETGEHNFVRMYYDGRLANWNADPVAVTEAGGGPQDVFDIDFRVVRGREIRGFVFYDANGDGIRQLPDEHGLANLWINAELQDFDVDHVWGRTEADGTYVLHGVYPGHHLVSAHAGGTPYASELYKSVGGLPVGTYRRSEADQVDTASGDAAGVDLSLELGGGITGTVRDAATGDGLAADLWVNTFDGDGLWWSATTDSQGRYLVNGLSPGEFLIQAWDQQGLYVGEFHLDAVFQEDAAPVHVVARSSPADPLATLVDFDLDQGGAIAGRVYDVGTGIGVAGVQVQAEEFGEPHRYLGQAVTEPDGTYRIGGLPPGLDLRVWVNPYPTNYVQVIWDGGDDLGSPDWNDAAPVSVSGGATTPDVDFALEPGGAVTGVVVDGNGDPLAGFWVGANQYDGGPFGGSGQTDTSGAYTIRGLIPGDYRVETGGDPYPHEYYDDRADQRLAQRVSVTAGAPVAGVDFVLPLEPRIVSGPAPAEGERGSTVAGVTLVADNLTGGLCGEPAVPPCVRIELAGHGATLVNPSLDPGSGTITFDLDLAADATLGTLSLAVVNDHTLEDGVAVAANAFEVKKAAIGDIPALSGERLYALDDGFGNMRVYGGADHSLLGTVETCPFPDFLQMSPDGSHAYVACSSRRLSVVDTRLGEVGEEVARIQLFGAFGTRPLALTPSYLYAVDRESANRIQVIDPVTWEVLETEAVALGSSPWAIRLDPAQKRLWVLLRNAQSLAILDVDPASATFHQALGTVPLPSGTVASDLAFTPDGAWAYVAAAQGIFAVDTALAITDPANAVVLAYAVNSNVIEIASHAASGKTLAFIRVYEWLGVLDVSSGPGDAELLRLAAAGPSGSFDTVTAAAGRLYVTNADTYELYAVDLDALIAGPGPPIVRVDARAAGRGLRTPTSLAVAPVPGDPPATAPQVAIGGGSPAVSGATFQVTLTGDHFAAAPRVGLQGTLVRGTVTAAGATSLTVDFPAVTPTGDYRVVVTNPLPGGNESGLTSASLAVQPPAGFDHNQTLYVARYGKSEIGVLRTGGADTAPTSQAYPGHIAVTPDGRLGFVGHYDSSEWYPGQKPESVYDMTIVDLDPASSTYLETVGTVPWVFQAFTPAAVTPNLDNENGIYVYAANRYMSDTVSVIDPVSRSEVDLDGDPSTESIPWQHPWWWWLTWDDLPNRLAGISRIELDGDVLDQSLQPNDVALTPDGTLLYTANRAGSVSIVDTVTHQPVGELTAGGSLTFATNVEAAPAAVNGTVYVYVLGNDASGRPSLFVFEAGELTDASAFVDRIVLPIQDEFPRELSISADGATVYVSFRYSGALVAMDVRPSQRGHYDSICVTEDGTVVSQDSLCTGVSQPIPGLLLAVEAAADGLLYVNNSFGEQIWVLDSTDYRLVTTLGDRDPTYLAVEPVRVVVKPVVTAVTPASGAPMGGDPVIVTGAQFAAGAEVLFGANPATGVVVESSYSIRAVTPASTPPGTLGPVDVKVINPDGKTGTLAGGFSYAVDATPPAFTIPPYVASQVLAGAPGAETVTAEIHWQTDEASGSMVEYREAGAPVFLPVDDPALVTNHVVTLTGLAPGTDHELRATSVDAQGNPAASPLVPFTTLTAPDVTAPLIVSGPTATPSTDSAVLQWETNEVASSIVQYDAHVGDGRLDRQAFGAAGTLHSVTLTGLVANAGYEYKVLSVDASGNGPTASAVATFTTNALPDATPPVITAGPEPFYLTNDLVIILWETDELATSFVNYGVSSIGEQGVVDLDPVTTHVVFLTDLLPGTSYGYQVGSTDASGNTVLSADPFKTLTELGTVRLEGGLEAGVVTLAADTFLTRTKAAGGFTTPEAPDTTAPQVISVHVAPLAWDRALITVATDEAASLRVRYGAGSLTETAFDPAYRPQPSLLLAGLKADTSYQLTVELTDPKGNAATAGDLTFTTPAAPDVTAPVLADLSVDSVTATTARVTWQTDEPADATVRFGVQGGALTRQAGRLGLATSHALLVTGLAPSTAYAFEAASRDTSGNAGIASGAFTTAAPAPAISSVVPSRGALGATLEVTVNGSGFGADSQVGLGSEVTVSGLTVNAVGSQLRATLTVGPSAAVGPRQIVITTHGYSVTAPFAIVDETVPVVAITAPADGAELESGTAEVRGTLSEPAAVTVNGVEASVAPGSPITFAATVVLPGAGLQRIVATAVDPSGNRGTDVIAVTIVNQPPVALCQDVVIALGPDCTAEAVIDAGSYDPDGDPITVRQEPAGPLGPGLHTLELTVEDDKGASASCSANVTAHFDFAGFLPPIDGADETGGSYGDPVRTFASRSTIPVKFRISCAGNAYLEGVHSLQTVQWSDETTPGEPIDATPQDGATTGNQFRLSGEEWHFNLDVAGTGMSKGQWQLITTLSDTTQHSVWIQVK